MSNTPQANKSNKSIIVSLIIFTVVILITWTLAYSNSILNAKNAKVQDKILTIENEIEEIKKDKMIQIYSLVEERKELLELKEKYNKIPAYVKELRSIWDDYGLSFKDFSYREGSITTKATAQFWNDESNIAGTAAWKIKTMLSEYRKNDEKIFDIEFVESFTWNTEIKFTMNLNLK